MKMIWHQTVSKGVGNQIDILDVQLQKIFIILLFLKDVFKPIRMIVDVETLTRS